MCRWLEIYHLQWPKCHSQWYSEHSCILYASCLFPIRMLLFALGNDLRFFDGKWSYCCRSKTLSTVVNKWPAGHWTFLHAQIHWQLHWLHTNSWMFKAGKDSAYFTHNCNLAFFLFGRLPSNYLAFASVPAWQALGQVQLWIEGQELILQITCVSPGVGYSVAECVYEPKITSEVCIEGKT